MGRIVVSENVTLDGVVEDPTGENAFRHGGWFQEFLGADQEAWAEAGLEQALEAEALLIGRRTEEYLGPRWMSRTGDWAERLNGMPKYVVSSTLTEARWTNSTVLSGDVVSEVERLKRELHGEILVVASRQLVQTLMEHDLVDELRLIVYPVVLGDGECLFGETSDKKPLRLLESGTVGKGLGFQRYEVIHS